LGQSFLVRYEGELFEDHNLTIIWWNNANGMGQRETKI
jgi:hypothetical protein